MSNAKAYIISALVLGIFSWYYLVVRAQPASLNFINAIVAFSAVIIIGFSFVLGPLSNFIKFFAKYESYRKTFGLIGYALAGLHIVLVVPLLLQEAGEGTVAMIVSVAVAAVAFMIFTLMALTSTGKWMATLGYENWKSLQRTGYIAIVLVMFHVALLDSGAFIFKRITGQIAIGFILLILLLRGLAQVFSHSEHRIKVE